MYSYLHKVVFIVTGTLTDNGSVATHSEKITQFQSALNLGPNQRTLNFQSALRVYITITFDVNF